MLLSKKEFTNVFMKKLFAASLILLLGAPSFAAASSDVIAQEHMFKEKGAKSDIVNITATNNIVTKGNVFQIIFDSKLWSEKVKAGEKVNFSVPENIYTQEGTLLIPSGSKVVATILKVQKPKVFNKNARVYLNFECIIFPDGSAMVMQAKPSNKEGALMEGPWMTAAKIAGSTIGLGAVGAGAGVGFAFIPSPEKLGAGFAIGIPVGCAVGLITGLVTPGLKYHAKAGESIRVILGQDLCLKKVETK